jgi:hypothetical protein
MVVAYAMVAPSSVKDDKYEIAKNPTNTFHLADALCM